MKTRALYPVTDFRRGLKPLKMLVEMCCHILKDVARVLRNVTRALTFRSGNNKYAPPQRALAPAYQKVNLKIVLPIAALLLFTIIGCQKKPVNAMIETSKGTIEVELFESDAPKTVANFVGLAEKGYFDGLIFHRVSKGFVIQGGDPNGNGTGGKSIYGNTFEDELNPSTASYQAGYVKGTLAMANRGPNTNTSQFFIMLRDVPSMPKNYTIFGKVVKGLDVVDSIGAVDIVPQMGPNDGKPKVDVVMKKVTVAK
jgi:peptidyl-prolyl cis-trans isomerase-like 1